jgi:RimJ/RimL family protein N-acetyltransferase
MIATPRLTLRRMEARDCAAVVAGIGAWEVARNLAQAPYPYSAADFQDWTATHDEGFASGENLPFGMADDMDTLIGGIGLHLRPDGLFELGYWIGMPHWGHGLATEAGHALLDWFRALRPEARIKSNHFKDNPASGRVLTKLGFVYTGRTLQIASLSRGCKVDSLAMIYQPTEERP